MTSMRCMDIFRSTARSRRGPPAASSGSIDTIKNGPFGTPGKQLGYPSFAALLKGALDSSMTTLLLTHRASLDHLTPPGHPERPDRIRAIEEVLGDGRFDALAREQAPEGSLDLVTLCHDGHYIDELRHVAPSSGLVYLDGDTSMSPGTWEAAMRGVGGAVAATEAVFAGKHDNAFVATRPPGHHAETNRPMGFCLFDHAAIAARHAQRKHGIARAAVVDFDVHHGTGTSQERGEHDNIVNAPLAPEDGSAKFRAAFENLILPQLTKFSPEIIIISAGFDAHYRDPLASLNLRAEDFGWVTRKVMDVAET